MDLAEIDRRDVRLLRHQESRNSNYLSPYILWRDHRDRFEAYQQTQAISDAARLRAPYWAAFVGVPGPQTLFVGIYSVELTGVLASDRIHPITGGIEPAGESHLYRLELRSELQEFAGRLWIDWGRGYRSWIQRGDREAKQVVELRRDLGEPPFPGFPALIVNLSEIDALPATWTSALSSTRGVYLLTCPKTREQYVGMASGIDGFMGRWRAYFASGHGGNVALKCRDPSDYQVSILETVGTGATLDDLQKLEDRWKKKLQSRDMGLNRN
ncbi:MAG: GIY-YIG nuclease family protein [Kaiparowitsia implicata GSE-PSE-MK54-09C]|nr:GIY-YIG nuclease family protein [Kaiparowitsia implicata GSE-PSE-MK54-09C]